MEREQNELTLAMAFVVYAYAAVALGLPFIVDADPPSLVFFGAWLGSSMAAGFCGLAVGYVAARRTG